jgi:hypothetical protein
MALPDTVVTLTFKRVKDILTLGGCPSWKATNRNRVQNCVYLICTRNVSRNKPFYKGPDPHGLGFLIGRLSEEKTEPTPERSLPSNPRRVHDIESERINILIREYAHIHFLNLRQLVRRLSREADRNPVHFVSMHDLGIDGESLDWLPVPPRDQSAIDRYNRYHTQQRREENMRRGRLDF